VKRRRERLVRRLSGCLDALPRMERATLILRYGVGPVRVRSGRQAARLLDVSRSRVRQLERRAVRLLADAGRETSCERTGISQTSLVAVYDVLTGTPAGAGDLAAPLAAGAELARAAAVSLDEGEGAVAGVRESGEAPPRPDSPEPEDDGPASSAGASLGNPFGDGDSAVDDPLLLLLLAIVVASLVSAAREIRRAVR
jgi:hypothetical protein